MTVGGSGREMRHSVLDRQSGVSFVELLITTMVLSILADLLIYMEFLGANANSTFGAYLGAQVVGNLGDVVA